MLVLSQQLHIYSQCRIAAKYLEGTKKFSAPDITEAPLIVFINSRSGGRAGPKLTQILYQSLGHAQVRMQYTGICFLSDERPLYKVNFACRCLICKNTGLGLS